MKKGLYMLMGIGGAALGGYAVSRAVAGPGANGLVTVPAELEGLIALGLSIVITFALTQLTKVGLDFTGYKAQILAAVYGAVMVFINGLLAKVPASAEALVTALLSLLVAVLGSYGVHSVYKTIRTRARPALGDT